MRRHAPEGPCADSRPEAAGTPGADEGEKRINGSVRQTRVRGTDSILFYVLCLMAFERLGLVLRIAPTHMLLAAAIIPFAGDI
jgi:hypothetical protein